MKRDILGRANLIFVPILSILLNLQHSDPCKTWVLLSLKDFTEISFRNFPGRLNILFVVSQNH